MIVARGLVVLGKGGGSLCSSRGGFYGCVFGFFGSGEFGVGFEI